MAHLIVGILLLVAGCLLQVLPNWLFAPWGSYPVARREIGRIIILTIGAIQFGVGLEDVIQNEVLRGVLCIASIAIVVFVLTYAIERNRRK